MSLLHDPPLPCTGFLGMRIATFANARTAVEARKGIANAFMCVMRSDKTQILNPNPNP